MDYYCLEKNLQVLLEQNVPLSEVQNRRIRDLSMGVLLAGSTALTRIARWLPQTSTQDSRVQWLRRTLQAPYLNQEWVYQPLVKQALADYKTETLHVIMDRTPLQSNQTDLLSLNLSFRHRAIPLEPV